MQAKRKYIQQELDLENGYITLETKKPKLKGTKYVRECYARKRLQLKRQQAQIWKLINQANDWMSDEATTLLDVWIPKQAVHLYLYYAGNWNKQTQTEFYENRQLNLPCNFVDVVQSKRKNLADRNDNIADQASKASTVLPPQSSDPIYLES
jgi:hypothetical protein